jgi:Sec-independent protein translocase protein TatA
MFDVTWGEIAVLAAVGLTLLGRKDLPPASRALGMQVGRVVGLLRGARLRADQYATDHQLRRLQNEFKSGLRELDAVRAELAGSMMMGGGGRRFGEGLGGGLGASVPGVDRDGRRRGGVGGEEGDGGKGTPWSAGGVTMGGGGPSSAPAAAEIVITPPILLSPRSRSVAAVAEEEWERRGIGFRSIAEGGGGCAASSLEGGVGGGGVGGAVILSNHLRQSLIYDQYERAVREQDEALRSRVDRVRNERIIGDDRSGG